MSRRYGRVRCPKCHTWYGLDETHACPSNATVMAAVFPTPGRVEGSNDIPCWDDACEHRGARAAA